MDAAKISEILKTEYGINTRDELEVVIKNFTGISLGIFTEPLPERRTADE